MFKIHYFHNAGVGRWVAFLGALAFEFMLATRVWYLVHDGFNFLRQDIAQIVLAWIVAPAIGGLMVYLFIHGGYAIREVEAYDRATGKYIRTVSYGDGTSASVRYNRLPTVFYIYLLQGIGLLVEWVSIVYTAMINFSGQTDRIGYTIIFMGMSLFPVFLGKILYAQINKPLHLYAAEAGRSSQIAQYDAQLAAAKQSKKEARHKLAPEHTSEQGVSVRMEAPAFPMALSSPKGSNNGQSGTFGSPKQNQNQPGTSGPAPVPVSMRQEAAFPTQKFQEHGNGKMSEGRQEQ
jgi:phosphate/sulfate permease